MGQRLAAILAADVVGYARLMGADEAATLAVLKALRSGFIEPLIADHRGRVVKLMGDGFCGDCGTPLTWEGDGGELGPIVELHISRFDDPPGLAAQYHLHHDERIAWFNVADTLPRYHASEVDGEPYRHVPATTGPAG